jgi:hypothetical protein
VIREVTRPCLQWVCFWVWYGSGDGTSLRFWWCSSSHDSTTLNDEDKFLNDDGFRLQARRCRRTSSAASFLSVSTRTLSLKTCKEVKFRSPCSGPEGMHGEKGRISFHSTPWFL